MIPKDYKPSGSGFSGPINATLYGASKVEVEEKKKKYFMEYNPMGYDTRCDTDILQHKDGYWYVRISRWSSCD